MAKTTRRRAPRPLTPPTSARPSPPSTHERLRRAVIDLVRGKRGMNRALADAIGRTATYVSEFMKGDQRADLDTALAIMQWVGWTVDDAMRAMPRPDPDPMLPLQRALYERDIADAVSALIELGSSPPVRAAMVEVIVLTARDIREARAQSPRQGDGLPLGVQGTGRRGRRRSTKTA